MRRLVLFIPAAVLFLIAYIAYVAIDPLPPRHLTIAAGPPASEYDGFALFEAPDDTAAAAVEIATLAVGHLRSNRLLRVLSAEEMHTALAHAATAPNITPKHVS